MFLIFLKKLFYKSHIIASVSVGLGEAFIYNVNEWQFFLVLIHFIS